MIFIDDFCGYERYTIASGTLSVSAITLGATVTSIRFAGRETVLGYPDAEGYLSGGAYVCAAIGRYANRIAGSRFTLNGREYALPANEGANQLHGGPASYDKRLWTAQAMENAVRFTLTSPDGDNGYPGTLTAAVTYSVTGSAVRIDYEGDSDADTVYAPTTHLYFKPGDSGSVLDTVLQMNAPLYLPVDGALIPSGGPAPAAGDFDFSAPRRIGRNFDHCFVLSGERALSMEAGGLRMDMHTDLPAVQIYTGEHLGAPFGENGGLAIEPEFYPDSPNRPDFPSTVLRAGQHFHRYAIFEYSKL